MSLIDFATVIGIIAAVLVNVSVVPQIFKSWKAKKTEDISFWMYAVMLTSVLLWLIYGILINNIPILISDSIGIVLIVIMIYLKLKYG